MHTRQNFPARQKIARKGKLNENALRTDIRNKYANAGRIGRRRHKTADGLVIRPPVAA